MTKNALLAGLASIAFMAMAMPAEAAPVEFTEGFSVSIDYAQTPAPAPVASLAPVVPVAVVPTPETAPVTAALDEPMLNSEDLADLAGQGDAPVGVLTEQSLTALNTGNSVIGGSVGSGAISIDQNAFSGFDGIGNFVINSGHNNTLQSSLSVSIVITQ